MIINKEYLFLALLDSCFYYLVYMLLYRNFPMSYTSVSTNLMAMRNDVFVIPVLGSGPSSFLIITFHVEYIHRINVLQEVSETPLLIQVLTTGRRELGFVVSMDSERWYKTHVSLQKAWVYSKPNTNDHGHEIWIIVTLNNMFYNVVKLVSWTIVGVW